MFASLLISSLLLLLSSYPSLLTSLLASSLYSSLFSSYFLLLRSQLHVTQQLLRHLLCSLERAFYRLPEFQLRFGKNRKKKKKKRKKNKKRKKEKKSL
jgi:hypothetical protein